MSHPSQAQRRDFVVTSGAEPSRRGGASASWCFAPPHAEQEDTHQAHQPGQNHPPNGWRPQAPLEEEDRRGSRANYLGLPKGKAQQRPLRGAERFRF